MVDIDSDEKTCVVFEGGQLKCWGAGTALGYGNTQDIGDDETPADVGFIDVGGCVASGWHVECGQPGWARSSGSAVQEASLGADGPVDRQGRGRRGLADGGAVSGGCFGRSASGASGAAGPTTASSSASPTS